MDSERYARSQEVYREACRVIPGGVNTSLRSVEPHLIFSRAEGGYVWDIDGNRYIDYHAAFSPILLGHCYPEVTARVVEAIGEWDLFGAGTTPPEIELCGKIVEHVPSADKAALCNSGSEATHTAIRIARAATGRQKVLMFQGCYHGWHDYTLQAVMTPRELLGKPNPASSGMMDGATERTIVCEFNNTDMLADLLKENRGEVACIILEPIPHAVGCLMPRLEFLTEMRRMCDDEGIVLIFDEVVTGFRHALGGYQSICGVTPDLTTLGKAVANGFPLSVVCGRAELMDRLNTRPGGDVFFAGTFNGHVAGVTAALATMEVLENEPVYEHLFYLGERMRSGLGEITNRLGIEAQAGGFGSVFTLYFMSGPMENYTDLLANDPERYVNYRLELLKRGIYELPMNLKRSQVTYSHTEEDIDRSLEAAEESLRELLKSKSG